MNDTQYYDSANPSLKILHFSSDMKSIKKQILIGIGLLPRSRIDFEYLLMHRMGRGMIVEESSKTIEQVGNTFVYRILSRMGEYEAYLRRFLR